MARAAKKDAEEAQESEMRLSMIPSLISKAKMLKKEMEGPRGELGDHFKTNVEEVGGFNRKAFKAIVGLDNMEETQRLDWLRTFDAVRAEMDWDSQGDFFADRKEPPASAPPEEQTDAEASKSNVTALKRGIKQLEPTEE